MLMTEGPRSRPLLSRLFSLRPRGSGELPPLTIFLIFAREVYTSNLFTKR